MASNDPTTGRVQLNSQLIEGAKGLAGPAADIARGATLFQAATGAIKGAALDKLLGPTAIFAGGLVGILSTIRAIVHESQILEKGLANIANLQQIEGKFTTLLKSAELAKKRIQELYQFTANSPFKFNDVAEANRILQALTKGAYSGAQAMQEIGDTAAATGQDISGLAERVGKLYSALSSGRSIDKVAFQLQYSGVVTEALMTKLENLENAGASFGEKWDLVTKSLAANQGGMRDEMKTLDALQTKLGEASAQMAQAFAEPFVESQSKSIEVMTAATKNLTPVLKAVGSDLAIVSGLVTDFKTGLVENTLATSGFATALRGAWEVGKGLFITLSAITAIRGVLGAGKAVGFVGKAAGTAKDSLLGSLASPAGVAAKAAGSAAAEALAVGNLKLAASEGLVAAQFQITARAAAVRAAAMEAAAGSTGLAAVSNGALAATSAVAAGATAFLGRIAVNTATAIRGAFAAALANPLGLAVVAVYTAVTGFLVLNRAASDATDELKRTKTATADLNRELDRAEANFQTTDDWAAGMKNVTEEIAKADQAIASFRQKMKDRSLTEKIADGVSSAVGFGTGATQAATEKALSANAKNLRDRRTASFRFLPTLGPGSREAEAFARDLRTAKESNDTAFQNKLSLADDRAAIALMDKEIDRLGKMNAAILKVRDAEDKFNRSRPKLEAEALRDDASNARRVAEEAATAGGLTLTPGEDLKKRRNDLAAFAASSSPVSPGLGQDTQAASAAKKRQLAAEQVVLLDRVIAATATVERAEQSLASIRRNADSELIRNSQRILDLREKAPGDAKAREEIQTLERRNLALQESVKIVDDEIKKQQQLKFERTQRANAAALAAKGTQFDRQISIATAKNDLPEVDRLNYLKQIALIEEQIAQARAQGNQQAVETLKQQQFGLTAERIQAHEKFAGDVALERRRNLDKLSGNSRDIQNIDDFEAQKELIRQYKTNGLSEEQARKDFALSVKARPYDPPRVSVDALQSVGGGGFSSGQDYPRRQVALTEKIEKHLADLVKRSGREATID